QEGTAGAQRYVVHPIVETLLGRDIGGIYPRLLFHEGTVEAVTEQQDGKAEEEKEHLVTSILIWRRPCAELRWPEVQITPQLSAGGVYRILAYGRGQDARRCYQVLRGFTLVLREPLDSNCPDAVRVAVSGEAS